MSQLDVAILRALRQAGGNPVADEIVAAEAGADVATIENRIGILREAGYDILQSSDGPSSPRLYRFAAAPDRLIADDLRASLGECRIGNQIIVLEETGSTNDTVVQMLNARTAEGLVVFAERQTAGRGQRDHRWESASHKGLWFSILLRPRIDIAESPRLTSWAAQAIAETINDRVGAAARIKPPNDIYLDGRKIAGVLVEMRAQPFGYAAIAGIGVNLNQLAEDFSPDLRARATSVAISTGRKISRHDFAVALLRNLDRTYATFAP